MTTKALEMETILVRLKTTEHYFGVLVIDYVPKKGNQGTLSYLGVDPNKHNVREISLEDMEHQGTKEVVAKIVAAAETICKEKRVPLARY